MIVTIRRLAAAGALLLAATLPAGAFAAPRMPAAYDGLWSVLIITEKGACDRGYRYAVRIRHGVVAHADPASSSFRIAGRVGAGGAIRVSVSRGEKRADGRGRMSQDKGAGRWRSSRGECSGIWQAERRGS